MVLASKFIGQSWHTMRLFTCVRRCPMFDTVQTPRKEPAIALFSYNINVYAKFHHNIPLSSRDSAIITFLEFGTRQSLGQ